jgi:two-component system KDP operon response regulator KdpE
MSLKILLVEDDRDLRYTLRDALSVEGYDVRPAASLADASAQLSLATGSQRFDLLVLDLGLPDGDGSALLAHVRRQSMVPVVVISAQHDEGQKIRLLDAGADDYVTKPFSVGELLARIRVALRHRGTALSPAVTRYEREGVHIDLTQRTVHVRGSAVHLTPTEYQLLARLVRTAGQVVTHRQLLADVWGAEFVDHTHYLRLYMAQLRAKIEVEPAEPCFLLTETGVGYRLVEADTPPADAVHMRS